MKKFLSSLAFAAAGLVFSSHASAGLTTWTDTEFVDTYIGVLGNHSYVHNLTSFASPFPFQPGGMKALKGTLSIEVFEDVCLGGFRQCGANAVQEFFSPEIIMFQIEDFDFDTGTVQLGLQNFNAILGFNALASINGDGMLNVIIQSLGDDFVIGNSTLVVEGVPEPEILGLFGMSLLGLSWIGRRRRTRA